MDSVLSQDSGRVRFLAFSCSHCPLQNQDAVASMLRQVEDFKPDVVVHLGDGFEAAAASRWPHEYDFTLYDEFRAVEKMLLDVERCAPDARLVYMMGNHCDNLIRLNRIDKQLRGLCDWRHHEILRSHWQPYGGRWRIFPYEYNPSSVFRLGQVSFYHGYEVGVSADEMQSYVLGVPNGLAVCGHTHRPLPVTQAQRTKRIKLPYWYANAGTLGPLKPPYVKRQLTVEWGPAVVVGECNPKRAWFSTRQWDAETRGL